MSLKSLPVLRRTLLVPAVLFVFALLLGGPRSAAQAAPLSEPAAPQAASDFSYTPEEILGGPQVVFGEANGQAYAFAGTRLMLYHTASANFPLLLSQFTPYPGETIRAAALYQGRYAFLLTSSRFAVLDLSSFGYTVQLTSFTNPAWSDLYLVDNLLVLVGSYQMNLYQINSPASIVSLSGTSFAEYPVRQALSGRQLYRALSTGLEVVGFSDPLSIQQKTIPYTLTWSIYGLAVRSPYVFLHGYADGQGYVLQTLNLADLNNPQVLYTGTSTYADRLTAVGSLGYACSGGYLRLFDLSDPAHPAYLGDPNHPCTSDRPLLSGSRYFSGGSLMDISDPANPKLLGRMHNGLQVDALASGTPGAADQFRVYVAAESQLTIYDVSGSNWRYQGGLHLNEQRYSLAYAAYPYLLLLGYNTLDVVDVHAPAAPVVVRHYEGLFRDPRTLAFYDAGAKDYLYVAQDDGRVVVLDMSNPADPAVTTATAELTAPAVPQAMLAAAGRLYLACGSAGVQVYSLSAPAEPSLVGSQPINPATSLAFSSSRLYVAAGSTVRVLNTTALPLVETAQVPAAADQVLVSGSSLFTFNGGFLNRYDLANPDAPRWASHASLHVYGRLFSASSSLYIHQNSGPIHFLRPRAVQSQLIPAGGGTFPAANGSYTYTIPACALPPQPVLLQSGASPDAAGPPDAGLQPVSGVLDFAFVYNSGTAAYGPFYCDITVQAAYPASAGLDETSLAVYYWSGSGWVRQTGSSVDTVNHVVSAQLPPGVQRWGLFAALPASPHSLFLPLLKTGPQTPGLSAPGSLDLSVQSLEPVQVTTPAPLVAGKATLVRVYVSSGVSTPVYGVRLALHGTRNNAPLPGSPLIIESGAVLPVSVRDNLAATLNIPLPASWLQGTVTLTAVLDYAGEIAETNEGNNSAAAVVTFNAINPLQVVFVPIQYTHLPTGDVYPPAENRDLAYDMRQLFPVPGVNVSYRTPVAWAGDLSQGTDWLVLLSLISQLKESDKAASSTLYYGVIPTRSLSGATYSRAWGGYGYISKRVAIGVQDNVSTFAHEAGHNLGLGHAPCGEPSGPDPSYPYPDGRIGATGVNAATLAGYNAALTMDFMTYCYPEWISDYFYQKLYNNQRSVGALSASTGETQAVLVVRAGLRHGAVDLLPVYRLDQPLTPLPGSAGYRVDLLDAQGQVLASAAAEETRLAAEDLGFAGYEAALDARLPVVDGAARVVIRDASGIVLAERNLGDASSHPAPPPDIRMEDGTGVLTWPSTAGLLRVSIRASDGDPWQLYALDWPTSLPLSLPPGTWLVDWSPADQP